MRNKVLSIYTLIVIFLINTAFAIKLPSVYEASVPVASQSPEDRKEGEKEALAKVFVKVSGNVNVMDSSTLTAQLNLADRMLESYGYETPSVPSESYPYLLKVSFDQNTVNRLLRAAGASVWQMTKRPLIIIWAVYQTPTQPSDVVNLESQPMLSHLFQSASEARGVPIVFPVMDLTDINAVSSANIAALSSEVLKEASKRYAAEAILMVNLQKGWRGNYTLDSRWAMGKNQWTTTYTGKTPEEVITALMNNIADTLAQRYASAGVDTDYAVQAEIKITGLAQPSDLDDIVNYLKELPMVEIVAPENIMSDQVVLIVTLNGTRDALVRKIAESDKLLPISVTGGGQLIYQWSP